jgi:hypothetical protein
MTELDKKIEEIKNILTPSYSHLFVGGELVASEKSTKNLKDYIKQSYNPPKKNLKAYLIRLKVNKTSTTPLILNCTEMTITPKLTIKSEDDDGYQTVKYSKIELNKYGFKLVHIKKLIKAIKNETVDFDNSIISVTELLKK